MGFKIREVEAERKFSSALTVDALQRAIPHDAITSALEREGVVERRERKLTLGVIVWLVIALNL